MGLWEISNDNGATYTNLEALYFIVASSSGTGMLKVQNIAQPLAQQPGSTYQKTSIQDRPFILHGSFNTESDATKANYHSRKRDLLKRLNANAGLIINQRPSPIVLKYTGGSADKIIYCYYEGGFEESSPSDDAFSNKSVSLRFVAYDPFFYDTSESSPVLDNVDTSNVETVIAKIDGLWDNLGPPSASGTYTSVLSITEDDTYIYFGGSFSNFDNIAAADNLVRYNKSTGAYSAVGTSGANNTIWALAILPNGDLVAGGDFTTIGGTSASRIAVWNGSSWSAYGTGSVGRVYDIAVAPNGNMYIAGIFSTVNGVTVNNIAEYDGSSWNALGTTGVAGGTAEAYCVEVDNLNNVYVGGDFANAGGIACDGIAVWNGSAWSDLEYGGTSSIVWDIKIDSGGNVYAGGQFSGIGNISSGLGSLALWNGSSWFDVGGGVDFNIYSLAIYEGNLYLSGNFTTAGSIVVERFALWNGSVFSRPDVTLPGTPTVWAIEASDSGLWLGFSSTGTAFYAGDTTISYAGSAIAYPYITINRSGGTTAKITSLANQTTGAELYLDYDLQDGETLTIDARPTGDTPLTAVSSYLGPVAGAIRGGSDLGSFFLTPGYSSGNNDNIITLHVPSSGSPTITATLYYTATYLSQD